MIIRLFPAIALIFLNSLCGFTQDISRVRNNIEQLTSPAFHGRGAVSNGERLAAEYIRQQFQTLGLEGFDSSYFQTFRYSINTFPKKVKLRINGKKLETGKDFIVNPVSGSGKGRAGALLFDTTILTSSQKKAEFLRGSMAKKAVFYYEKDYSRIVEGGTELLDKIHEAPCIIEIREKKLTASLSQQQYTNAYYDLAKDAVPEKFSKVKFRVDAKMQDRYTSQNVVAFIEGKSKGDSVILISAHYDHLGRMGKKTYFPGANDNASGVSMLLELAAHYSKNPPEHSIVFIAFGAEEVGLIGSKYYTEHPLFPLRKIKFMINLDLLGTGDEGMMVVNGSILHEEFALLDSINKSKKLLPELKKRGAAANSDHYFFFEKGVPAFFFYTLGGIKAYHDIYDKPETLPLTKFREVFELITDFVKSI